MTDKTHSLNSENTQPIATVDYEHDEFKKRTVRLNAIACNNHKSSNFDIKKAEHQCQEGLKALGTQGGLQEMLAAQMLSVHHLQQVSIAMANETTNINIRQYFSNTATKLANTFVQQATLLSRLQGNGGQKIIVERVDIHKGGQAIVGVISGGFPTQEAKK